MTIMNPPADEIVLDKGGKLYYEPYTRSYVRCHPTTLLMAKYELNRVFVENNGAARLYDFIKWLGIKKKGVGYSLGWEASDIDIGLKWIYIWEEHFPKDECMMIRYMLEPSTHYPRE